MKLAIVFLSIFFMLAPALAAPNPAEPEKDPEPEGEARTCVAEPCFILDPTPQDDQHNSGDEKDEQDKGKPDIELED